MVMISPGVEERCGEYGGDELSLEAKPNLSTLSDIVSSPWDSSRRLASLSFFPASVVTKLVKLILFSFGWNICSCLTVRSPRLIRRPSEF